MATLKRTHWVNLRQLSIPKVPLATWMEQHFSQFLEKRIIFWSICKFCKYLTWNFRFIWFFSWNFRNFRFSGLHFGKKLSKNIFKPAVSLSIFCRMKSTPSYNLGHTTWDTISTKYPRVRILATFLLLKQLNKDDMFFFLYHTYSRSKSNSDFFCSVGESGDGGLSLSMIVGPAASSSRCGLERN